MAIAGLAVGAALALPGMASGQAPDMDSVTVGQSSEFFQCLAGQRPPMCAPNFFFALNAQSGPSGENPTGPVSIHFGGSLGPTYAGTATCLAVHGNQAVVGFAGTFSATGFPPGTFAAALRITDVASPDPFPDTFVFQLLPSPGPTNCSSIPPPDPQLPTYNADVLVHDAQPQLPTSKAQCKNGGWRNYGSKFKNQGQCVAFVVKQARQKCLGERAKIGLLAFRNKYGLGPYHVRAMRRCVNQASR